jgi:DNA-binding MarR family transcriptional regulator
MSIMNKKLFNQFMLWFSLHRISGQISKHEESLLRKSRLTRTQHRALLTIAFLIESKKTSVKITDLVPYQNSTLVSVSLIVARMEKKGLIKKVRDISDRRVVIINITPRGKKLLEDISNPTTDLIQQYFSVYNDAELIQMTSLVNKLGTEEEEEGSLGDKVHKLTLKQRLNFLSKLNKLGEKTESDAK